MYILIAGARTKERQAREPQEKQPRSSRKQRLKLHLCEQVTLKIARWFLERNRWHFTCQQRVLCNRKTSKRPLHCHSLMDLRKQLTLVEKKKSQNTGGTKSLKDQQTSQEGPSAGLLLEYPKASDQNSRAQPWARIPRTVSWTQTLSLGVFRKTLNSGEVQISKLFSQGS